MQMEILNKHFSSAVELCWFFFFCQKLIEFGSLKDLNEEIILFCVVRIAWLLQNNPPVQFEYCSVRVFCNNRINRKLFIYLIDLYSWMNFMICYENLVYVLQEIVFLVIREVLIILIRHRIVDLICVSAVANNLSIMLDCERNVQLQTPLTFI